jgi:O-antigen ligase
MTEEIVAAPAAELGPTRSERLALRVLQLGAIAVVLVAMTDRGFDLDRFLVPKELVLHVTALLAGLLTLRARSTRVDLTLLGFLLLSGVSMLLATNPWLGFRALAVSVSAVLVFRAARAVPAGALLNGIALAVVIAAGTALLQTYGIEIDLFSPNRAPGGTLGNRNFIGHAAAFGLPVVLFAALRGSRLAPLGVGIVTAALILTRSRAAWLATAIVMVVFLGGMLLRANRRTWLRFALVLAFAFGGGAAALLLPNTLRWRSDNPYLESIRGVAAYDEGSGRGRLVQYGRSMRMAAAHPLLGVGPGNWPVEYPAVAARRDPSLDPNEPGMTYNPWPSSDWVAFLSERGLAAAALLLLAMIGLGLAGLRAVFRAVSAEEALPSITLLGTLAGAMATGAFDAVLLLAAPALLVWATVGALLPVAPAGPPYRLLTLVLLVITGFGVFRSASQAVAIEVSSRSAASAVRIDPGNYRLQLRAARSGKRAVRCGHARTAHELFPHAEAAARLAAGCD